MSILKFSSRALSLALAGFISVGAQAENMVLNGDFSDGWNNWSSWMEASTDANVSIGGNYDHARWDIIEGGSEFWYLQLYQTGMNIEQGKTYELSFDTDMDGSFTSGVIDVVVEESSADYTHYMARKTVPVYQYERSYTFNFTMEHATDSNARVIFHLGANDGSDPFPKIINIDNVSLKEVGSNLIQNASFDEDLSHWAQYIDHAADAEIFHSVYDDVRANIIDGGNESWHVQLSQAGLNIEQGKTYALRFYATTSSRSAGGAIDVVVEENGGNYTHYMPVESVEANPGPGVFEFTFTMNHASDSDARLTFNLGNNDGPEPGPSAVIIIDYVELREVIQ